MTKIPHIWFTLSDDEWDRILSLYRNSISFARRLAKMRLHDLMIKLQSWMSASDKKIGPSVNCVTESHSHDNNDDDDFVGNEMVFQTPSHNDRLIWCWQFSCHFASSPNSIDELWWSLTSQKMISFERLKWNRSIFESHFCLRKQQPFFSAAGKKHAAISSTNA